MFEALVSVLLLGVLGFIFIVIKGRKNYGFLENCGFPVIKPTLFLGSTPNLHNEVIWLEDVKRYRKYGKVWGVS